MPKRRAGILALALAAIGLLATPGTAPAAVEVPFAPVFASSGRADLTLAANTLLSCPASGVLEAQCLGSRQGEGGLAALNNNAYEMAPADIDADPATFDSSAATLALPAGASVEFAGLFYGARTSKGEGPGGAPAPDPAARGSVLLKPPGAVAYTPLTATVHDSAAIAGAYTGYADVTQIVAAAGSGSYTVANVQAGTGVDRYAGWALVVAYGDPAAAPHSVRVYEGLASIQAADPPLQIAVDGLETPALGSVSASVGVVAYEGDRGSSGDRLLLNGTSVADAANPANNVFNSSIAFRGADLGGRSPNYLNQLGFDADVLSADGILANGASSAVLEESTSLEQYLTQVVAVSIQLDPAALEPPPPPPSPPPASGSGSGNAGTGSTGPAAKPHKKSPPREEPARLTLDVEVPSEAVPPTAVVSFAATVGSSGGEPARNVAVCTRLPRGLDLLRAPGAKVDAGEACWRQAKLKAGAERTFRATAQVAPSAAGRLRSLTTVRAGNAPSRRARGTIRVVPLADLPCGRLALAADPVAQASC